MTIYKAVALRITNLMNEQRISQYELSKRSAVEQSTIYHILNEDTKQIGLITLAKIIDAFGLTFKEFFDDNLFEKHNLDL